MKNLSRLIFVIFSILFFASCGGNEAEAAQENSDSESENIAVSLRTVGDADCVGDMGAKCARFFKAVSFQIKNNEGETVFEKLFKAKDLKNRMPLKGIPDTENATLIVSAFGSGDGGADLENPKWQGKTTGLNLEKGKETNVKILLYPTGVQKKESLMPGGGLEYPRFSHTSTVLKDGRILIAGGFTECGDNRMCTASKTVEIIDPESGTIELLSDMAEERAMHTAIALNDGSVLLFGGVRTFDMNEQEKEDAFTGYPPMRFVPSSASGLIEKYMPPYPKYNMRENNIGSTVPNYPGHLTLPSSPSPFPFYAFQSVLAEISGKKINVFLVGGVDENKEPSNKIYKFAITEDDDGTVSVGKVKEFESSEPMLLPALVYSNGSIIAAGGRPAASEYSASVISESKSEDFGTAKDNIFFTAGISLDGNLYTFGGYGVKDGLLAESNINKIRKWNASEKSVETAEDLLRTRGKNIIFPATVYDERNDRFIVIGGTDAADIYQVVNQENLELNLNESHTMTMPNESESGKKKADNRIMSSAAIVPAGIIGDSPIIVITGGITALDGTGEILKTVKINNL